MSQQRNIVTLKWGSAYGAEYVNRLFHGVSRHLSGSFRFVCFTDDADGILPEVDTFAIPEIDLPEGPMTNGWRKLCLFRDTLPIEGSCLFLDLDMIILDSIDDFFTYEPGRIPIIHNWVGGFRRLLGQRPEVGNSSVFRFEANKTLHVYEQFLSESEWALKTFHPPQTYLTHCIRERMVYWPEDWTRSFKRHCRPFFPLNLFMPPPKPRTKIVVFHGRPNPDEAIAGFSDGKIHHRSLPAEWVREEWQ